MSDGVIFRIRDPSGLSFGIGGEGKLRMTVGDPIVKSDDLPDYPGPYEVTPGPEKQILSTKNKALSDDITVGPIPRNYGLITYQGHIITVS